MAERLLLNKVIGVVELVINSKSQVWLMMMPVGDCQFFSAHISFWNLDFDGFNVLIVDFVKLDAGALAFTLEILSNQALCWQFATLKRLRKLAWSSQTALANASLNGYLQLLSLLHILSSMRALPELS